MNTIRVKRSRYIKTNGVKPLTHLVSVEKSLRGANWRRIGFTTTITLLLLVIVAVF